MKNNPFRLIYLPLSLVWFLFACNGLVDRTPGCCAKVSPDMVLDVPPVGDIIELGGVVVETRFDSKAVIVAVKNREFKTAYFYSEDGGDTWHPDDLYQRLRARQTHILQEGEILPWDPNPADSSVMYRTVYHSVQKSYNERSTDGGGTWVRMKQFISTYGEQLQAHGPVLYHPSNPLTFYIPGALAGWQQGSGMYMTVDGGDLFKCIYQIDSSDSLAISSLNPKVMFCAGKFGSVLRSKDGGKSWDLVGQNDSIRKTRFKIADAGTGKSFDEVFTDIYSIAIDPVDVSRVYLATSKGLLRSENGGETWCILETGITNARAIQSIVIMPGQPNILLVGTYKGLLRSMDGGCHWESIDVVSRLVQ